MSQELKSIAVDFDTWSILSKWAEEECRSVSGQVRYLVKNHGPLVRPNLVCSKENKENISQTVKPTLGEILNEAICGDDPKNPWITNKCTVSHLKKHTVRRELLNIIKDWETPITNSYLAEIANLSQKTVNKQTSSLFAGGLLKRKKAGPSDKDRYEYMLTSAGKRLLARSPIL
jgi:predicted transcriptional regulator|tara:strand:- start:814 stop:1335 length:522 start_codon:yes stop_codon:yes gene_type:complete